MQCTRAALADRVDTVLPGLGKKSRLAVCFDKVAVEGGIFSRKEALMLIGIGYVDPDSGQLTHRLAACPATGFRGDGGTTCELVLGGLREKPLRLRQKDLQARLAAVGGDGAVVEGGVAHRHASTKAADIIWKTLHPALSLDLSYWDLYHRLNTADLRALRSHVLSREIIDVHIKL